jgi:signal transduction histidine kinase
MRRLWVRLSLAISGLIAGVIVLMLAIAILFTNTVQDDVVEDNDPNGPILPGVVVTVIFSAIGGIVSGVFVSRILSAPITQLATAAKVIGSGDLNYRVNIRGSQEIIELGQAFNQMAMDLQQAEVLRRNLMADVSHELRTPLTVLEGHLRAALDHIYALDEAEIANLYAQTHHLIRLINDLHELAQAEAHQLPLHKTPTDVPLLLQELRQTFEPLAEEKQVTLHCNIAAPVPLIPLDTARIRQVLHNLVGNALQYTPTQGTIMLGAKVQDHELHIIVQDSGIGIAPEHLAHVFDRFYRVDFSRSRGTGGSGLGLAIVKAITEIHGGHVVAHSDGINQGASFTLTFPIP